MLRHLLLPTAALLAATAQAQDIRVLTLDTTRSLDCGPLDFNVPYGSGFTHVRQWLEDPARFGAGGTVGRAVTFAPQVEFFDPATLATADVVLIAPLQRRLLRCEIADLLEFVRQGGGLFAFANAANQHFNDALGATGGAPGAGAAVIVEPNSAVANGPFGTVTGSIGSLAFHRVLTDVGPFGRSVVETNGTFIAEFDLGFGRFVSAGDEEWVLSMSQASCAAGQLPDLGRERLFLNAFASVVPAPGFQYVPMPQSIGTKYCGPANLNSRGLPGETCAFGSSAVIDNDVTLATDWLPDNSFGYYLGSQLQGFVAFPGGSQGNLCLANPVGRFNAASQIQNSGSAGFFTLQLDLANVPQPTGFVAVQPGETWNFQAWYRDSNPNTTSNFSDAVALTFQ